MVLAYVYLSIIAIVLGRTQCSRLKGVQKREIDLRREQTKSRPIMTMRIVDTLTKRRKKKWRRSSDFH
ncbi:hypothetical protein V1478_010683 [Vespula squamosa]|uniref:Secreted protein n=1 Tax=Vespula squamosa TaxID=30214 RepID=A0ABD2AIG2_VESSQ